MNDEFKNACISPLNDKISSDPQLWTTTKKEETQSHSAYFCSKILIQKERGSLNILLVHDTCRQLILKVFLFQESATQKFIYYLLPPTPCERVN